MMEDLEHVLPETPKFERPHKGWMLVDGSRIPKSPGTPAAVRVRLPETVTREGQEAARNREVWLETKEASLRSSTVPDRVVQPSALVDQEKLRALKRAGVRLEIDRGGRKLGELVHAVLAVIPLDRPDLVEDFVWYFGTQRNLSEETARKAAALVRAALASDAIRVAAVAQSWREVPFAVSGPDGMAEGSIDLLVQDTGGVTVVDFKTDYVAQEKRDALEELYEPQLDAYTEVAKRVGIKAVAHRLVHLVGD